MDSSFFALVARCLFCSAMLLFLCLYGSSRRIVRLAGPGCIMLLMLACILRQTLPFGFSYVYDERLTFLTEPVRRFLVFPVFSGPEMVFFSGRIVLFGGVIRVWHVLTAVWVMGAVVVLVHKARIYRTFRRVTEAMEEEPWEKLLADYGLEKGMFRDLEKTRLVRSRQFRTPFLTGMRRPCLILPALSYSREQLCHILLHEEGHLRGHDIFRKGVMELFCVLYWWDPVMWYARSVFFRLTELDNDRRITAGMTEEERTRYMECLCAAAAGGQDGLSFGAAFDRGNFRELRRRMELIGEGHPRVRWLKAPLFLLTCLWLVLASSYIDVPGGWAKLYGLRRVTPRTTCFVENDSGYDMYIWGIFACTANSPEILPGAAVYHSPQEAARHIKTHNE